MSIAKIDVDVKMDGKKWENYLKTRYAICGVMKYSVAKTRKVNTIHGVHIWIHLFNILSTDELAELQFLLGDDQGRCRFNFLRNRAQVFHEFNALFSKKLKRKRNAQGEAKGEEAII